MSKYQHSGSTHVGAVFGSPLHFCVLLLVMALALAGCGGNETQGLIVFSSARTGRPQLFTMTARGERQEQLLRSPFSDESPWWSPDMEYVVYSSERSGVKEICILERKSGRIRVLTSKAGDNRYPAWSPDGSTIAFQSNRRGWWEIYLMNAEGTGQTPLPLPVPGKDAAGDREFSWLTPAWYPDSKALICAREDMGKGMLWKYDCSTKKVVRLTSQKRNYDSWPSVNERGEILFCSDQGEGFRIYLYRAALGKSLMVEDNIVDPDNMQPRWSPDGKAFLFVSSSSGHREIYSMPLCEKADRPKARRLTRGRADSYDPCWGMAHKGERSR